MLPPSPLQPDITQVPVPLSADPSPLERGVVRAGEQQLGEALQGLLAHGQRRVLAPLLHHAQVLRTVDLKGASIQSMNQLSD